MELFAVSAALLLVAALVWREYRHDAERARWDAERAELLTRIQHPGRIPPGPGAAPSRGPRLWTDSREADVELRLKDRDRSEK